MKRITFKWAGLLIALRFLLPGLLLGQEQISIPAEELAQGGPSRTRIVALVNQSIGQKKGWGGAVGPLRSAAIQAYETNPGTAGAWYFLYRWADFLSTSKEVAINNFTHATDNPPMIQAATSVDHTPYQESLAVLLSQELQVALLSNPSFSAELFSLISPRDNAVRVLAILQEIAQKDLSQFMQYQGLALAIAVVYDSPPPADWPEEDEAWIRSVVPPIGR